MKVEKMMLSVVTSLACGMAFAAVKPAAVFSDHAVLLKSADTPVFGFADPGEKVKVALGGVSAEGTAGADGRWLVRLDLRGVGPGPFELDMNGKVAKDVLVGEVWLCSGQSNMSFAMKSADDAEEENRIANPLLRSFNVASAYATEPRADVAGRWVTAGPGETLKMSAVGYHFAKRLQQELSVPVGFVNSSVGAASIEAWCDPVSMAVDPNGKRELDRQIAFMRDYRAYEDACDAALVAWAKKWNRADRPHGGAPATGWRALTEKERETYGHGPGAVWFRRTVKVPDRKPFVFARKRFIEKQWRFDTSFVEVYWNGARVARTFPEDPIEKNTELYVIPAGSGTGTLDVRVFSADRIADVPHGFHSGNARLDRAGWTTAEEFALPPLRGEALAALPPRQRHCLRQHWPTGLFNGMIAGLVPMGLSGVIWYQGESNASRAEAYDKLFATMIRSWRKLFGKPELPFAWCQLAAYMNKATRPFEDDEGWPKLRAAQTRTLALPMTGQAVLIDAGEESDIHPRDKRTPGARLAAWALNRVYGRADVPYRGPHATSVRAEGNEAVVTFVDCGKGLKVRDLGERYPKRTAVGSYGKVVRNSPNAQAEGFAVAGADGVWQWADKAEIAGDAVRVSSDKVAAPTAVRYGWSNDPWVNLYNADGLPAEPFEMSVSRSVSECPGYNAWPMIQAIGEKLVCAYSRGSGHSIGEGRRDAFARVSADGGKTWGPESVVSAHPGEGEVMIGKGLDSTGAALFWVRCLGKARHHDLYRTTDGVRFEKIASPRFDPFPMQVTDIVKTGRGLLCLWFQTDYSKSGKSSWGTLTSADDGRTWTQRTVERDLALADLPTEPSVVNLGGGRLLGLARTEIAGSRGGRQFQLTSTDDGLTWRKAKTNIGDILISTPSLVYDPRGDLVCNYYYERGKGRVKRRVARASDVFVRPAAWPEPTVVAYGHEERPFDAGNVNVTVVGDVHFLAYYYGTKTDASVYVKALPFVAPDI